MNLRKILSLVLAQVGSIFTRVISMAIVIGLLSSGILSVKVFAENNLDLDGYRDDLMDRYFKRADKEEDDRLWRESVESNLEIIRSGWESKALKEIDAAVEKKKEAGDTRSDGEIRSELEEELIVKRAEWEKDADEDVHKEYGRRLKRRIDIVWHGIDESRLLKALEEANQYLYEINEDGYEYDKYGYRVVKGIDDYSEVLEDFDKWDDIVKNAIGNDIAEYEQLLDADLARLKENVRGSGVDIDLSDLEKYIDEERDLRLKNFEEERWFKFKKQRSDMKYTRLLDNRSLRKDSEKSSPDVIVDKIITDTQKDVDKAVAKFRKMLDTGLPEGSASDIERFNYVKNEIEDVFNHGMLKWRGAEEELIAQRIKWEQDGLRTIKEIDRLMEDAFKQLEDAREKSLSQLDSIIAEAEELLDLKEKELMGNLHQMQGENDVETSEVGNLNKYLDSLKEEWSSNNKGLIDTINNGISMVKQADENIKFFKEAMENAKKLGKTELVAAYKEALIQWEEYRTKFAGMVWQANEERQRVLDMNMGNRGDLIPGGLSSDEYNSLLSYIGRSTLKEYYIIDSMPKELELSEFLESLGGAERSAFESFIRKYYSHEGGVYRLKDKELSDIDKYEISYYLYDIGYRGAIECTLSDELFAESLSFGELNELLEREDRKGDSGIDYRQYYAIGAMPSEIGVTEDISSNDAIRELIEKYYTLSGDTYVMSEDAQIPQAKKYELLEYLGSHGVNVDGIECSLEELKLSGVIDYSKIYNDLKYREESKSLLKSNYVLKNGEYVLSSEISGGDKVEILKVLDYAGFSGYKYENDQLTDYIESGVLTDYDIVMLEASDSVNYWENRLAVIDEVIKYAENVNSGQESKEATLDKYDDAKDELERAKEFYESKLGELEALADEMDDIRELMKDESEVVTQASRDMEKAKAEYLKVKEALERAENELKASLSPFHEIYCNLLQEMKTREDSKNRYYDLLVKKNGIDVIEKHYVELTKMIRGDGDANIGLDGYREIKESFVNEDGSNAGLEIVYESNGDFDFDEAISGLSGLMSKLYKDGYKGELKRYVEDIGNEKYDDYGYNFKDISPRTAGLNINDSFILLKLLRGLKKISKRDKDDVRSDDEYRSEINSQIYEIERQLLVLKTGAEKDFEMMLANVYYEVGDKEKSEEIASRYIEDYEDVEKGDELYKEVLFERLKAELKAKDKEVDEEELYASLDDFIASDNLHDAIKSELDIDVKEDEIISRAREFLLKYQYNKSRLKNSEELIKKILSDIEEITTYEELSGKLAAAETAYKGLYDAYRSGESGVNFEDIEKLKWYYDVLKSYVEEFNQINSINVCALGLDSLDKEAKEKLIEDNKIVLGLIGAQIDGDTIVLDDEDMKKMSIEELGLYNMLKDEDKRKEIKDNLVSQYKRLLISLGVVINGNEISFKGKERSDVQDSLNDSIADYIKKLKEKGEQELRNIGEKYGILGYLESEGAGYGLSGYGYYDLMGEYYSESDELKSLEDDLKKLEKEKADESKIEEKRNEIEEKKKEVATIFERVRFAGQSDYYVSGFLRGVNTAGLSEKVILKESDSLVKMVNNKRGSESKGVYKYKNQKEQDLFDDINEIVNGGGSVVELRYFLENYFNVHRGELSSELENVLDRLYSSFVNMDLAESLSEDRVVILAILNETDIEKQSELQKKYYDDLAGDREDIRSNLIVLNQRLSAVSRKIGDFNVLERDLGNIDNMDIEALESLMDQSYSVMNSLDGIEDMANQISLFFKELSEDALSDLGVSSEILKEIREIKSRIDKVKENIASYIENIKSEYIKNVGLDVSGYFITSIKSDGVNYLTYLEDNDNKEKALESIKSYLEMKRDVDFDDLSEEEQNGIMEEIEFALAREYVIESKYVFSEEEKSNESDGILVERVDDEVDRVLGAFDNLSDVNKSELEKYIRVKLFGEVEDMLEASLASKAESNAAEQYYSEKLAGWLEDQREAGNINFNNDLKDRLYNDFVVEYLDTTEYASWTKIEQVENSHTVSISGDAWKIVDDRIVLDGQDIFYLEGMENMSDEALESELGKVGIYMNRDSKQLVLYNSNYDSYSHKLVMESVEGSREDAVYITLNAEEIEGDSIIKSALDFSSSSFLTMIYNGIEKYMDAGKLVEEAVVSEDESVDETEVEESREARLAKAIQEIKTEGLKSYIETYSSIDVPDEFKSYLDSYAMTKYADSIEAFKEYSQSDDYKKLTNEYRYRMMKNYDDLKDKTDDEKEAFEDGIFDGIETEDVSYASMDIAFGELGAVYESSPHFSQIDY